VSGATCRARFDSEGWGLGRFTAITGLIWGVNTWFLARDADEVAEMIASGPGLGLGPSKWQLWSILI